MLETDLTKAAGVFFFLFFDSSGQCIHLKCKEPTGLLEFEMNGILKVDIVSCARERGEIELQRGGMTYRHAQGRHRVTNTAPDVGVGKEPVVQSQPAAFTPAPPPAATSLPPGLFQSRRLLVLLPVISNSSREVEEKSNLNESMTTKTWKKWMQGRSKEEKDEEAEKERQKQRE